MPTDYNNELILTKKRTKDLVISDDDVVTDVQIADDMHKSLLTKTIDFSSIVGTTAILTIDDFSVTDVKVLNSSTINTLKILLPEQVQSKSREFMLRFSKPTDVKLAFVEADNLTVTVESNDASKLSGFYNDSDNTYVYNLTETMNKTQTLAAVFFADINRAYSAQDPV